MTTIADIDCPECGKHVTLDERNAIPYHSDVRDYVTVCRSSGTSAGPIIATVKRHCADMSTAELIEALEKRGLQVLNAPLHAEITKAAREAERSACVSILERRLALYDELISEAIRDGFSTEGWRTARAALLVTFDEIRDRSSGGAK